jgi:thiamine biosynthesis lipoprotein
MKYTKTQFLMWTNIDITIISNENPNQDIFDSFWIFYSLEKEFSRFLDDSDLNILNKNKEFEVSNRFIDVLNKVKKIYIDSDNFFNPLINLNNIWYSWDFKKWLFEKKNEDQDIHFDNISILWNYVILKENQNLDLWWIVKGYWVDLVSDYLKSKWYINFIINAGWDIYLSWNTIWWKTPVVAIDNPFNSDEIFATLELKDMAISTSWTYKRNWKIKWETFHHILDPKWNINNNEIISITLISNECFIADSYATSCIAMWIKKSLEFLKNQNIDWVIIWSDWNIYKTKWMDNYNFNII